jgi:hypothetical protein
VQFFGVDRGDVQYFGVTYSTLAWIGEAVGQSFVMDLKTIADGMCHMMWSLQWILSNFQTSSLQFLDLNSHHERLFALRECFMMDNLISVHRQGM